MGMTLPTTTPPIRVAEEYGMLDCISGGRLVAGLPLGSPMDVNHVPSRRWSTANDTAKRSIWS